MARQVDKLSALAVRNARKPGYYGDGGGLWLQVSKSGAKSWVFRYRLDKPREMGIGSVNTVSLSEARQKARECRLMVLEGKDPIEQRKAAKLAEALERANMLTFDECAAAYIAAHRSSWKNLKHAGQWENTIATYASPTLGKMPVALVDTALVVRVLEPIWETKSETAYRLRGRIESILDWATVRQYRQGENPARWRGHLENLLAKPNRAKRTVHHPELPWPKTPAFMAELRARQGTAARAVELAILTACRSGEIRLATWEEFDLNAKLWVIPAERMKAGREHRVPLSSAALELLESLPRTGDLVFPGAKTGKPLSDMSLLAVLRRMGHDDITVHGFRATFRMWCAESVANAFPREVCEHALAHSLPNKVEAAYQRGDLLEKRVMLMQAWSDYCGAPQ